MRTVESFTINFWIKKEEKPESDDAFCNKQGIQATLRPRGDNK
jgi:hypothetical protein